MNIRFSDLVIGDSHLSINIPHSKNDQIQQGSEVLEGNYTGTRTCLVAMLEEYGAGSPWAVKTFIPEEM